ncbi:MAG: tetratricopeptide repeat protein [Alphaproteobacteria bacterium]|nr:tetratricopeptide repeat protein [Alphaproteobacteria bacterium]
MTQSQEWLNLAKQHRAAGRLAAAEMACKQGLEKHKNQPQLLHFLSMVLYDMKRPQEALEALDKALAINNSVISYHNNRAVILYELGLFHEAELALHRAIVLDSRNANAYNNLGNVQRALKKWGEAETHFRKAISFNPDYAEAYNNLGLVLREIGQLDEAEQAFRIACDLNGSYLDALYNLSTMLIFKGSQLEAEEILNRTLELDPTYVSSYRSLFRLFEDQGRIYDAYQIVNRGLEHVPQNHDMLFLQRQLYSAHSPSWVTKEIHDDEWTECFEKALAKAIIPGAKIIEFGAGSGLKSMLAAKFGASQIVSCEPNIFVAEKVSEIVKNNGFEGLISIHNKTLTEVTLGEEVKELSDLLLWQPSYSGLTPPQTFLALRYAQKKLLKSGAQIIPNGYNVYAILVECPLKSLISYPINRIAGFDLSPLNAFSDPHYDFLHEQGCTYLSEPFPIFSFDHETIESVTGRKKIIIDGLASGTCHGVVLWFDVVFDAQTYYSIYDVTQRVWREQLIQFFEHPFSVTEKGEVSLEIRWDEKGFYVKHQDT